mmetsp:Transcript_75944/g.213977  ORF Transcript_75944/g.213977 Transcript_75944/m.213977 type:complete len:142 (-) Transcript_75944:723-1148(-)
MSLEELGFKVDQLSYTLDERKALHVETMKEMRAEITALRGKMREHLLRLTGPRERPPADSTFVRRVEWRISDVAKSAKTKLKNEAMWSDHFTVMGVKMQLEFFSEWEGLDVVGGILRSLLVVSSRSAAHLPASCGQPHLST